MGWLTRLSLTAKLILAALTALLLVIAVSAGIHALTAKPKAEAKLATNQTQAAQANGTDAVNAVGAAGKRDQATDDLSRSNANDIDHAKGSDAAVDPASRDAALRSLCRRAAYRSDPKCVQFSPAK